MTYSGQAIATVDRCGKALEAGIGPLALAWDRHAGGELSLSVRTESAVHVVGSLRTLVSCRQDRLSSSDDPDPRIIVIEQGPHRLGVRTAQRLYAEDRIHAGDALQEAWAWADGTAFISTNARWVDLPLDGRVDDACVELSLADGWVSIPADDGFILQHDDGPAVGLACLDRSGAWAMPQGDQNPWQPLDGHPPYYGRWGPYYDQWGGEQGWRSITSDGGFIRFSWTGDNRPEGTAFGGTFALVADPTGESISNLLNELRQPPDLEISGGRLLYRSLADGAFYICSTADALSIRNSSETSSTRVVVFGRTAEWDSQEALPFPLTDGGVSDDPNGPDLLRPDDPHGPILTDETVRPGDLVVLNRGGIALKQVQGIRLAGRRWDERQELLLYSSAETRHPLMALSTRDLKARELRIPGTDRRTMAHLPMYWFRMNAPSAHHCLNVPEAIRLLENGPDRVVIDVQSHNPARTALSQITATIPFEADRLTVSLRCQFEALADCDWPDIQYCNFFPETTRLPELWSTDRVLVMAADGQMMRIDPRERTDRQIVFGERFERHEGPLFVALYGGQGTSILSRAMIVDGGGMNGGYKLCGCWLDNHLFLRPVDGLIEKGTKAEVKLEIVMVDTRKTDAEMEELGKSWVEGGNLCI